MGTCSFPNDSNNYCIARCERDKKMGKRGGYGMWWQNESKGERRPKI